MSRDKSKNTTQVLIWDLPTRIFHWSLAMSFTIAWLTFDDNRYLYVHVFSGYTFFGLLLFRLLWGIVGSQYSRFRTFAYDWPSVFAYLKGLLNGQAARHVGHNPAGSWAIFLMLTLGVVISITGILVLGGEEGHGILADIVPYTIGEAAKQPHILTAWIMLAVTGIHITGVIIESLYHKENLILSMITGRKEGKKSQSATKHKPLGFIILTVIVISGLVYFKGYLTETKDQPYLPFIGSALPDNETWRSECSDCHLAYHPVLLPARSWRELLHTQNEHFDEDLGLDAETIAEIENFLMENASESKLNEPARKINASTPADKTPLRIIETAYWLKKHKKIKPLYWKDERVGSKGNCEACHLDAKQGTFEDSAMRLPKLLKK